MSQRLVVLGGSFNPPTKAHKLLLRQAMEYLHADKGIFVPSSNHYVRRKVGRKPQGVSVLPEQDRLAMLTAMCDPDMQVDTCEFGDMSNGRTLKTLQAIQAKYPLWDVWFIMGTDKIKVFSRWGSREAILNDFHILWAGRDGLDARSQIINNHLFSHSMKHMAFLNTDPAADNISSSAFWKLRTTNPTAAYDMLHPAAASLLKATLAD